MNLEAVTDKWEEAAKSDLAQAHIHPSGAQSLDNYEASGLSQAAEIQDVINLYGGGSANPRVADFGCGDGRVAKHLSEIYPDLWGIDASPTMLERYAERVPGAQTLLSNGVDKGLKDLKADLLFSWAVFIHHAPEEGRRLMDGLASGVKKGALLALQIPLYELPVDGGSWCSVTVWTPEMFKRSSQMAGLKIIEMHVSPGSFSYEEVGVNHTKLQVMRRI